MSLSKYYKNSKGFQPDRLVKKTAPPETGWQPDQQGETQPFQAHKLTPETPPPSAPPSPAVQEKSTEQKANGATGTAPQEAVKEPTPPPPPPIDMSQYVRIEEAEANAYVKYQEGVEEGLAKAAADYGSATRMFSSVCDQLDNIRETIINNSSEELLNFAFAIAERIIRTSVKELDQTILATVNEALQRAVKSDEFTIFIHPDDYETIKEKSEEIISGINGLEKIIIKTDPTIEKGGAKIESDNCIIDATVTSQFDLIREEILHSSH